MKKIITLLFFILIGLCIWAEKNVYHFFERTAPSIRILSDIKGLGAIPAMFKVDVIDEEAGLDEVVIRNGKQELLKVDYDEQNKGGIKKDTVSIIIDAKALNLKDGEQLNLDIKAFDKSFFSNGSEHSLSLKVDYIKPRAEVLTVQHNGFSGGALMVLYKHLSDDIVKTGVKLGESFFQGYPAKEFDSQLEGVKDIYFSLFPIPVGFDGNKEKAAVTVVDEIGNQGGVVFYQHINLRKQREEAMKMPKQFFVEKINDLLPKYYSLSRSGAITGDASDYTNQELADNFKLINQNYRALLEEQIQKISLASKNARLWQGVFMKPLPAAPTATFAEKRKYNIEGVDAGGSTHMGVDLAQSANAEVGASNAGEIVFADDFGIYGNAVIIDHGFGLLTLYGHLSSINVQVGDLIQKGTKIGRTGATGLAGGDHLHFEFRLQGVPVTPFEWLDPLWINSHIEGQTKEIKKTLGIIEATNGTQKIP